MFCSKCGQKIEKDSKFCTSCGASIDGASKSVKKEAKSLTPEEITNRDKKVFKIVSYIGIMWLLGLFCGSKNDKKVKLHVGQGILLSLYLVAIGIVSSIFNVIIVSIFVQHSFYGYISTISTAGIVLLGLINFVLYGSYIFFMVMGIINAAKDNDKKLPIIGSLAFYK